MKNQLDETSQDHFVAPTRRDRGLDLLLTVDRDAPDPLRVQIERQLRTAIRSGRLLPATVLPSTRALARELGVSRGVVVEAYAQLAAEGFVAGRRGSTTHVLDVPTGPEPTGAERGAEDVAPTPAVPAPFNLLPMAGDLTAFPRQAWRRALRRALDDLAAPELSYGDAHGPEAARASLARYLGRSRGVVARVETTAFVGGVTHGLDLVARVLVDRGVRAIAVEDPGFPPHRTVLEQAGLRPHDAAAYGVGRPYARRGRLRAGGGRRGRPGGRRARGRPALTRTE